MSSVLAKIDLNPPANRTHHLARPAPVNPQTVINFNQRVDDGLPFEFAQYVCAPGIESDERSVLYDAFIAAMQGVPLKQWRLSRGIDLRVFAGLFAGRPQLLTAFKRARRRGQQFTVFSVEDEVEEQALNGNEASQKLILQARDPEQYAERHKVDHQSVDLQFTISGVQRAPIDVTPEKEEEVE